MQQPTETGKANSCELLRNSLKKGRNFEATLDKVNELMLLAFEKNIFDRVEVDDSRGNKITEQNIGETENKLAVKLSHTATESYIVTLRPKSGGIISKKANNQ